MSAPDYNRYIALAVNYLRQWAQGKRATTPMPTEDEAGAAEMVAEALEKGDLLRFTIEVPESLWQLPGPAERQAECVRRLSRGMQHYLETYLARTVPEVAAFQRYLADGTLAGQDDHGTRIGKYRLGVSFLLFPIPMYLED